MTPSSGGGWSLLGWRRGRQHPLDEDFTPEQRRREIEEAAASGLPPDLGGGAAPVHAAAVVLGGVVSIGYASGLTIRL